VEFLLTGLNIGSTPLEVLERVTVSQHALRSWLDRLATHAGGGVLLSTCNRTEVYTVSADADAALAQSAEFLSMIAERDGERLDLSPYIYTKRGDDVARHLFRVTAGLDSTAMGEAQVAGQVSRALQAAGEEGTVEPQLSRMFHAALRTSRRIHTDTALGRESISIASIGIQLLTERIPDLSDKTVFVMGAGETGRLAARTLRHMGVGRLIVSSRSPERAGILSEELNGDVVEFENRAEGIAQADVLVTCTAAALPIIELTHVARAMKGRANRPLHILDVGLPRDVAADVDHLPGVIVFDLEKLQAIAQRNREQRTIEAGEAERMIEAGLSRFNERLTGMQSEPVIRSLASRIENMRQEELERTVRRLDGLTAGQLEQIDTMTRALVKRILADPITYLRSAQSPQAADAVLQIFDLYGDDEDDD